jgi:hypothetical protein
MILNHLDNNTRIRIISIKTATDVQIASASASSATPTPYLSGIVQPRVAHVDGNEQVGRSGVLYDMSVLGAP